MSAQERDIEGTYWGFQTDLILIFIAQFGGRDVISGLREMVLKGLFPCKIFK